MAAAKNSKDCSTQRCTTHQRQKSVIVKDGFTPNSGIMPNAYSSAILVVDAQMRCSSRMRPVQNWRAACLIEARPGHNPRRISALQNTRPMKKPTCQKRPSSRYDSP
ncbi:Uncharacterised protein [Burkholderia pseudomallei]|nr:hypothetical protein DR55_3825 [Burkholderia pseudomallei HBPUB10134a]CAJ2908386.1 Uncharacterised protein [Burkholderia pseudomallei]CAJ3070751.1 Uncharacterised protein [Burkholderia pseudomallei]CAJ3074754.1 Uncharacterised protein [Burkholderia pseudomallei]CAJ3121568.1 Uncharacterised protein [Burkholderia pseudomallei]